MMQEFDLEIIRLRQENHQLRFQNELIERDSDNITFEKSIQSKIENLENFYIGSAIKRNPIDQKAQIQSEYETSTLTLENREMKDKLRTLEEEKIELTQNLTMLQQKVPVQGSQMHAVRHDSHELMAQEEKNRNLKRQVDFLQKRERELLDNLKKTHGIDIN